jgi:hypothetical protein
MQQSLSCEANSSVTGKRNLLILWNLKIYCNVTRARHLSLSCTKSMQSRFASYILKISFNITFPNIHVSFKWSLSFRFPDQEPVCISPLCLIRATRSAPPNLLDFVIDMIFVESYKVGNSLLHMLSSLLPLSSS